MKKLLTLLSLVFCLFVSTACASKINAVKNAYVKEGYSWEQIELSNEQEEQTTEKKEKSTIKGVYLAKKGLTAYVLVIELQKTDDMNNAIKTLQDDPNINGDSIINGLINLYNTSDYTYGNCIGIMLDRNSKEVWDNLTGKKSEK